MIRAEAEGMTPIWACLYCMVSFTVIFRPFQSLVAWVMSSPNIFGVRPRGPVLGATTPPLVHLRYMTLISLGGMVTGQMNPGSGGSKKVLPKPPPGQKPKGKAVLSDVKEKEVEL